MNNRTCTQIKSLEFMERAIKADPQAMKCYESLRANGLTNADLFAELIGWAVITVVDKKNMKHLSLKTEAYFPKRLESLAEQIEVLIANRLFVPENIEDNDLPRNLRRFAEDFRGRLRLLKKARNGRPLPTMQALKALRWQVESETNKKASPACLAKILDAVLTLATADIENPPMYDFEANLKKIPPTTLHLASSRR